MKPISRRFALFCAPFSVILLASCHHDDGPVATSTSAPLKVIDTIMVPGSDDKLHARKVSRLAQDTQLKSGGNPAPALDEIIKLAPKWFPKGTRVEDVKDSAGIVTVLLSPEFGDAKHWSKGEMLSEIAVYSLVNTLAKDGKKVALTLEGKPISSLGEMSMSEALPADPSLNAPAKPATNASTSSASSASGANSASGVAESNAASGATPNAADSSAASSNATSTQASATSSP